MRKPGKPGQAIFPIFRVHPSCRRTALGPYLIDTLVVLPSTGQVKRDAAERGKMSATKKEISCTSRFSNQRGGPRPSALLRGSSSASRRKRPADGESGFHPHIVGPIGRRPHVDMLRAHFEGVVVRHQHGSHAGSMGTEMVRVKMVSGTISWPLPYPLPWHTYSSDPKATPKDNLGFATTTQLTPYLLVLFSAIAVLCESVL